MSALGPQADDLRSWIGREEQAQGTVTPALVKRYRATMDQPVGDTGNGAIAPRMIHWCLMPAIAPTNVLGPDGHAPRGEFMPPVQLPRRMWAGGKLVFFDDLRIGELATRTSRIAEVALKEGRTGPLCFVTVHHTILVNGVRRIFEVQDIVFRGTESGNILEQSPAAPGTHGREVVPTTTLLFRYSGLTFNGHRIHYDRDYAMQTEGYPGLVVHGPLQAALLYDFATCLGERPPARFVFRSASPLFDTENFYLNAEPQGDLVRLWTARKNGPAAMTAEASW
jgi:3-methylfumaryl-CoA hydratase